VFVALPAALFFDFVSYRLNSSPEDLEEKWLEFFRLRNEGNVLPDFCSALRNVG
jgi:hypothetical protein